MTTLVRVVFIGGPSHGLQVLMCAPKFNISIEDSTGEPVEYSRRMVETFGQGDEMRQVATYAPAGLSEPEFVRLVLKVAARNKDLSAAGQEIS